MGAQGTTTVNFGAFPGASDTSVSVTGQTGILSGSLVEAWIFPSATTDHSADEHIYDTLEVRAGNVIAGTGFTIYAYDENTLCDPKGNGTRLYGLYTVAWVWN